MSSPSSRWIKCVSKSKKPGKYYYYNEYTKESLWKQPRDYVPENEVSRRLLINVPNYA